MITLEYESQKSEFRDNSRTKYGKSVVPAVMVATTTAETQQRWKLGEQFSQTWAFLESKLVNL